jgi:hypothetical protein
MSHLTLGECVLALIAGIPATLTALAGFLKVMRAIAVIKIQINGRLSELIEANRIAAHAEGVSQGGELARADAREALSVAAVTLALTVRQASLTETTTTPPSTIATPTP